MNVLITGSAGHIGGTLRRGFAGRYRLLRLVDLAPQPEAGTGEECLTLDLADLDATTEACRGIDCVVHLAGVASEPAEAAWDKLLPANIVATYNLFEAARRAGVKRVVYASSNHVVGFYRRDRVVGVDALPRPDTIYGVSKVFGESLGRLYADKHGISVACLRIGSFREEPEDCRQLATWLSPGDGVRLVGRCIDAPDIHFGIVYGVSDNAGCFWTNAGVEWLGFSPKDRPDPEGARVLAAAEEGPLARMFHGGTYCSQGFDGDPSRID